MECKKMAAVLCGAALCLALGACGTQGQAVSSAAPLPSSSSAVASMPEVPSSSAPEPAEKPSPSSVAASDFTLFDEGNLISQALKEDLDMAGSFSAIESAYGTALARWKRFVALAYKECLAVLPPDEKQLLETAQAQWEEELEKWAQEAYEGSAVPIEGSLGITQGLVDAYEDRARTLCRMKYSADGVMPSFEAAMEEPEAAG